MLLYVLILANCRPLTPQESDEGDKPRSLKDLATNLIFQSFTRKQKFVMKFELWQPFAQAI